MNLYSSVRREPTIRRSVAIKMAVADSLLASAYAPQLPARVREAELAKLRARRRPVTANRQAPSPRASPPGPPPRAEAPLVPSPRASRARSEAGQESTAARQEATEALRRNVAEARAQRMRAIERREEDMARKREESREASLLAKQRIAAARTAWAEERAAKIEDLRAQWAEFKAKRTASEAAAGAAERTAPVLSGVEDDVGEQGNTRQTAVEAAHAKWEADRIGRVQALQRHWAEYRRRREESAKGAAYPLQGGTPGHSPR